MLTAQQKHHDHVYKEKPLPLPPNDIAPMLKWGTENELNALATLVGKFMPVFYPNYIYREDGCCVINIGEDAQRFAVVSGDGNQR